MTTRFNKQLRLTAVVICAGLYWGCAGSRSATNPLDAAVALDSQSDVNYLPDQMQPDVLAPDTLELDTRSPDLLTPDTLSPDTLAPDTLSPDTLAPDIVILPDGPVSCDDKDPCTSNDIMTANGCKGTAYTCDDKDSCTKDSCKGDGTCQFTPTYPCTIGFAIGITHYSSWVSSTSNRVKLMEIRRIAVDKLSALLIEDMGSFKDKPLWWDVWHVNASPPPLCYSRLEHYKGTIFEGLNQSYYAGSSAADLISKMRSTFSKSYTYRWPSNSKGGDLCKSGNWWTTMKFTASGATHIEGLLKPYGP